MHCIRTHPFGHVQACELGFAPIGQAVKTVYFYIAGGAVIDTGQHHMQRYALEMTGKNKISSILLTHHHEDHSGNAEALRRKCQVPVYAHPYAQEKLRSGFRIMPYQHILFGRAPATTITPYPERIEVGGLRFLPIHTPGHSKDHTVYLEENNGWLFSGDLFLSEKILFFRVDERMEEQILSLQKALGLDFDALFCGHRPCPSNGKERLAEKLQFLQSFHGEVGVLLEKGYSQNAIIRKLQVKSDLSVKLFTMGNASFANMVYASLRDHRSSRG